MKKWTLQEDRRLKEIYPNLPNREVGRILGRTASAVNTRAQIVGVKKAPDFKRMLHSKIAISEETRMFIRDNYHDYTNHDLADMAGVSESTVQSVRRQYDLEKENSGRFRPGQEAFNKGMKQEEFMSEEAIKRSKKTRFKEGHEPANTKWDGALSIRQDKSGINYMYIRVEKSKWELYHRYRWERHNSPIPDDHILRSINGDSLNCHPDNWELITRAEHAVRNQNREKASETMRKYWKTHDHPAKNLADNYVAGLLAGGDREIRDYLITQRQDLIRMARAHYKLQREINKKETHD